MQVTKQINRRNEQLNVHCGFVPDISGKTKKKEKTTKNKKVKKWIKNKAKAKCTRLTHCVVIYIVFYHFFS